MDRPEIEQTRINLASSRINLGGSKNAILPSLQAFVELTNNGLSGPVNPVYNGSSGAPDPYFIGGYGNFTSQILRRNFPNYSAGFSLNIPFRNRAAQADYVTDQLQLRQSELQLQKVVNQIRVDVKNAVIGLQQARARYDTAVATRVLAEQTLKAEQSRYQFGVSDFPIVVQAERDLAADQSAEVQATANYMHSKIAFEEAVGRTLEVNGISKEEATSGRVGRESSPPDTLPEGKNESTKSDCRSHGGHFPAVPSESAGGAGCGRKAEGANLYPPLPAPDSRAGPVEKFRPAVWFDSSRQALSDCSGCNSPGHREQPRFRGGPL